jgi:predicted kinase
MKLIVFSGLPGTGKSTLAEIVGEQLGFPVFAKDWLEAAMLRNGLQPTMSGKSLGSVGYELLTMLAERQLRMRQSVILDSVAATQTIRDSWKDLARQYRSDWRVVECVCSEEAIHRSRLKGRERNIPGWHELDWSEIEKVKEYYHPWDEGRLILDMVHPVTENLSRARSYCE